MGHSSKLPSIKTKTINPIKTSKNQYCVSDQIKSELEGYIFYIELFNKYIPKWKKIIRIAEVFTLLITIIYVISRILFPEISPWWAIIVLAFQILLFYRGLFFNGLDKLVLYNLVRKFYTDKLPEIESLWFGFSKHQINEVEVMKRLEKLRDEEKNMELTYDYDSPKFKEKAKTIAELETLNKLSRKFDIKKI